MTTIDKADLEAKLREIEGVVLEAEEEVRGRSKLVVAGVVVGAVALIGFGIWLRRRNRIRVEVYRL